MRRIIGFLLLAAAAAAAPLAAQDWRPDQPRPDQPRPGELQRGDIRDGERRRFDPQGQRRPDQRAIENGGRFAGRPDDPFVGRRDDRGDGRAPDRAGGPGGRWQDDRGRPGAGDRSWHDGDRNYSWRDRDRDGRPDRGFDGRNFDGRGLAGRDGRWGNGGRNDWGYRNGARNDGRGGWNGDWRDDHRYDWQGYRASNRALFRAPRYYGPQGYGYSRWSRGYRIEPGFYGRNYWINDPYRYRLPPVYGDYRWVRYYDDVALVDIRSGLIEDVIYSFFWR